MEEIAGPLDDVIDVGCGDLTFWGGRRLPAHYVGIDSSGTIIRKNSKLWPEAQFFCSDSAIPVSVRKARVVLCLNVLFHLMDDIVYRKTLVSLADYSSSLLFISTWRRNPYAGIVNRTKSAVARLSEGNLRGAAIAMQGISDGSFQRFRDFSEGISFFRWKGFGLRKDLKAPNPYGALYVFQRGY